MIKVMVVDDSPVQRELIVQILSSDPTIQIVATANSGVDALEKVSRFKPDVITMDIHMPQMNGIEATRQIMASYPVPIIIISGSSTVEEVSTTFKAMEAGAVSVAEKLNYISDNHDELIQTVKAMSEVKVVRRHIKTQPKQTADEIVQSKTSSRVKHEQMVIQNHDVTLIAVGVSTGGPIILQEIIKNLEEHFPPILIVQHISAGFLGGLVEWLQQTTNHTVKIANHGEKVLPSQIYLAPDSYQMGVDPLGKIVLSSSEPENGHRPSATYLFRSVAEAQGNKAWGVLLTGMGSDGAEGLKMLKDKGAFTVAQDEESSIIYGMPKEAVLLNAASAVLNPVEIAKLINQIDIKNDLKK